MSRDLVMGLVLLGIITPCGRPLQAARSRLERVHLPLISEVAETFSGDARDFFVRLPEHVTFPAGSEVRLELRASTQPPRPVSGVTLWLNDQKLTARLEFDAGASAAEGAFRVRAMLPEAAVQAGWNKISIHIERSPADNAQPKWAVWRVGSYVEAVCQRVPLFSEVIRFPGSLGEEKLLYPGAGVANAGRAGSETITVLLPAQTRDVHLRACAIVGARFGQLGYLAEGDCRVRTIQDDIAETASANGVVVGLSSEIAGLRMLRSLTNDLAGLKPGQGMVAELIHGSFPNQHRWFIASGADDAGLEKAILTLGSTPALALLPPSPAVIDTEPELPPENQSPAGQRVALLTPRGSGLASLLARALTAGRAPALLSRAATPGGTAAPMPNTVEMPASSSGRVRNLSQLDRLLAGDAFLRKAAFLLPSGCSPEEMGFLLSLAMRLGKQFPDSPALWPEALGYAANAPPAAPRLEGRSVLLLGPVSEWKDAVPLGARLPIRIEADHVAQVVLQGRRYPVSSFEPSLVWAQLVASPWSSAETLVSAGGWNSFATPALQRLLTESAAEGTLFGNLCAMDASGRIASYDTRQAASESFVERVQRRIPTGLNASETSQRLAKEEAHTRATARVNNLLVEWVGALFFLFVLGRLVLLWDQERRRKRALQQESPARSPA